MSKLSAGLFSIIAVVSFSFPAFAGEPAPKKADKKAAETKKGPTNAIFVPAEQAAWKDVPGMAGVQMAAVQGDPMKGPHHALVKFTAGFTAPLHHHTADHYVTVVSGTMVETVDGQEQRLPPGSFFAFTKRKQHETKCDAGADCIISVDARGKWDVVMPKEKKGPGAKPGKPVE
jgi:quercetin dioxygenase-like cupin family protein